MHSGGYAFTGLFMGMDECASRGAIFDLGFGESGEKGFHAAMGGRIEFS